MNGKGKSSKEEYLIIAETLIKMKRNLNENILGIGMKVTCNNTVAAKPKWRGILRIEAI